MALYAEEAENGLRLLAGQDLVGRRVLEVGAGLGLLSAWLAHNGVDVVPLEPGGPGFEYFPQVIAEIWRRLELPAERVLAASVTELDPRRHGRFDLVYSVNVLEHVDDLERAFAAIGAVMAPGARAVHHCPNYAVPFEPHYSLALVPFLPGLAGRLAGVAEEPLWRSLNFISHGDVVRLARANRQTVTFDGDTMMRSIHRLEDDAEFRRRHPVLHAVFRGLARARLVSLLGLVPAALATPMTFECRDAGEAPEGPA
jgi:SAM-dependent methyltransferase